MKLIMVSNCLIHHQLSLCEYLYYHVETFKFVALLKMPESLIEYGYDDLSQKKYLVHAYLNQREYDKASKEIIEADVVIFGASPNQLISQRMKTGKTTFLCSERVWKKGLWRRFVYPIRKKVVDKTMVYKNADYRVLCCGGYLSYDLSLIGFPTEKCYNWGYFPEVVRHDIELLFAKKQIGTISIIWVGRFVKLKRAMDLLKALRILKNQKYSFRCEFIGVGDEVEKMSSFVRKYGLEDRIDFIGSMSHHKVREHMEKAHIFVNTSNYIEGWGAVVNEAMNSGCATVLSHAIGSAPMLYNEKNCMVYEMGNVKQLANKVEYLMNNKSARERLGINGYKTVLKLWNGEVAGRRLLEYIEHKDDPKRIEHQEGPMAQAVVYKHTWFRNTGK